MSIGYALFVTFFYVCITAVGGLILTRCAACYLRYEEEHLNDATMFGCVIPAILMGIAALVIGLNAEANFELLLFVFCAIFSFILPVCLLVCGLVLYAFNKASRFADHLCRSLLP